MADTVIGVKGTCSDCGIEGVGISHWGDMCPEGHTGHFCRACWFFRDLHKRETGEATPFGTDWFWKAAQREQTRLEQERIKGDHDQDIKTELRRMIRGSLLKVESMTQGLEDLTELLGLLQEKLHQMGASPPNLSEA